MANLYASGAYNNPLNGGLVRYQAPMFAYWQADAKVAIPYIKKAEGGLSRATTDSASKHPAPWPYEGKTGWHTNKGITYATFESLGPKLGYKVTAENFFKMPDSIWYKIYKQGYWDPMGGDQIKSQAVANAIADWAWASGTGGARNGIKKWLDRDYNAKVDSTSSMVAKLNDLTKDGDTKVFLNLIEARKKAFIALNQPANIKGWLARMETLQEEGLKLVFGTVKKNIGKTIVSLLAISAIIYGAVLYAKKT